MPVFRKPAASPARAKLQETIDASEAVRAKLAELQGAIAKLNGQAAAVGPAQAAVAAHNEAEDFAALKWARGEGPRPEPDLAARDRLARDLAAARASSESATRASSVLVAQMTAEAAKPRDIAKWADSAVVEVIAETATPLVADLEADAIALVGKIIGLQTALNTARDINERRRPRTMTVEEHAARDVGLNVARHYAEHEDNGGAAPEALAAVGALSERLRPAVWARVGEAIVQAMHTQHENISAKVDAAVESWREFESDLRADSGVHFAGVR